MFLAFWYFVWVHGVRFFGVRFWLVQGSCECRVVRHRQGCQHEEGVCVGCGGHKGSEKVQVFLGLREREA